MQHQLKKTIRDEQLLRRVPGNPMWAKTLENVLKHLEVKPIGAASQGSFFSKEEGLT